MTPILRPRRAALALALVLALAAGAGVWAQAPAGYYNSAENLTGAPLKTALFNIIKGHTSLSYNAAKTRLWSTVDNRGGYVQCIYTGRVSHSTNPDSDGMNTEHSWPQSRGAGSTPARSDLHHLFVTDAGWNAQRSSMIFRRITNPTDTSPIGAKVNGNVGFEPPDEYKGDIARALFYFHVRYNYPLTDSAPLNGSNDSGADDNMGRLTELLQWHEQDPPSSFERNRNDRIYGIQRNRNPFIDRPEFVCKMFSGTCAPTDTTPPSRPLNLTAVGGQGKIDLDWNDNAESDLAGYNVYRTTTPGGPYTKINATLVPAGTSAFTDTDVIAAITYCYVVTAVDTTGNQSQNSNEACATPTGDGGGGTPSGAVWINEFHYDDAGEDLNEGVEIAGPAGVDVSGWKVWAYNGSGGSQYASITLSGVIPNQQNCFGTLWFAFPNLQNGGPDGLALADAQGALVQFLSYEGSFTGNGAPVNGAQSQDVGVTETSSTADGQSLQLGGSGVQASDFSWRQPATATPGQLNNNQTFTGTCGADTTPPSAPGLLQAVAGDGEVLLDWPDNLESDLAGYNIYRATDPANGPWTVLNSSLLSASDYLDENVVNGTTYYYVVTAKDDAGNESTPSNVAEATPNDAQAPAAPGLLIATAGNAQVSLDWPDNSDADFAGYNIYRAVDATNGPWTLLNGALLPASDYLDTAVTNGVTYYYVVTAKDAAGNESSPSNIAEATPQAPGGEVAFGDLWINEFHYDNSGTDSNEFVEVAGPATTDLAGWTLVGYNGSNNSPYATIDLTGIIPNQQNCYGVLAFSFPEIQNGAPDGFALVDPLGELVQFISYEGGMTGSSGPAQGVTAATVSVSETSSTLATQSLQLTGSGNSYAQFSWTGPAVHTRGLPNTGQTFENACRANAPDIAVDPIAVTAPAP
jgi:endonuclease I/fibronectin type 3 domain-containing protein